MKYLIILSLLFGGIVLAEPTPQQAQIAQTQEASSFNNAVAAQAAQMAAMAAQQATSTIQNQNVTYTPTPVYVGPVW